MIKLVFKTLKIPFIIVGGVLYLTWLVIWNVFKLALLFVLILTVGIWLGNQEKLVYALGLNRGGKGLGR